MKCPACTVDLMMTERHGIEIDYCPTCRGVWLDRGELDKIVERADADATRPAARATAPHAPHRASRDADGIFDDDEDDVRRRRGYGDAHPPYPRRKTFWSELFD